MIKKKRGTWFPENLFGGIIGFQCYLAKQAYQHKHLERDCFSSELQWAAGIHRVVTF